MNILELIEGTLEDYWTRADTALDGLTSEELAWRPGSDSNSIGFIAWHVNRVEDRWIQRFAQDVPEIWVRDRWHDTFGLEIEDTGVRFTVEQVTAFPTIEPDTLLRFCKAIQSETRRFLATLSEADLERVPINTPFGSSTFAGWSIGRMFRQIFGEFNQHLGEIRYVRGLIRGFNG